MGTFSIWHIIVLLPFLSLIALILFYLRATRRISCPKCSNKTKYGTKFCPSCGAALAALEEKLPQDDFSTDDDMLKAFVYGSLADSDKDNNKKFDFYKNIFTKYKNGLSWNWSWYAFITPIFYMLYRKAYLGAFIALILSLIAATCMKTAFMEPQFIHSSHFETWAVENVPSYLQSSPALQKQFLDAGARNASKLGPDAMRAVQEDEREILSSRLLYASFGFIGLTINILMGGFLTWFIFKKYECIKVKLQIEEIRKIGGVNQWALVIGILFVIFGVFRILSQI